MNLTRLYDPVHGFITLSEVEKALIRSEPFERLRYIHQCGTTFFVYPGATHKRFDHSLGVMQIASMIYKVVLSSPDLSLFARHGASHLLESLPRPHTPEYVYWKQALRLACLCHDLGHLPFSHVAEKALLREHGHEYWSYQILTSHYLNPLFKLFEKQALELGINRNVREDVIKLALGPKPYFSFEPFTPLQTVLSSILTGDFFGADRIDYLLRDAKATGLVYGNFDFNQLIHMLRLIPDGDSLALGVLENGLQACQALLLSRHFMFKKVYNYPTIKAYNFHLSRFMKHHFSGITENVETYLAHSDVEVLARMREVVHNPLAPAYEDALSLRGGGPLLRAVPLPTNIKEEDLQSFQEKYGVPQGEVSWYLSGKQADYVALNFKVIKAGGQLSGAEEASALQIPTVKGNWLYISEPYQDKFLTFSTLV